MWNIQMEIDDQSFSVEPPQRDIGAEEDFEFQLIFAPQRAGQIRSRVRIVAIDEEGNDRVCSEALNGYGIGGGNPEIIVEPEEVRLEIGAPDQRESFSILVSSVGDDVLRIDLELDEVEWVTLNSRGRPRVVNPGDETRIGLRTNHNLPENGEHVANLTITSNDQNRPEIIIPITIIIDIQEISTVGIELIERWNMISSNRVFSEDFIDDEGPDMQLIFEDIIEQIMFIKDGFGSFSSPEFDYWGIRTWETGQGYLVRTTEETELEITGTMIPRDREIFLRRGWNIVAYYPVYIHDHLGIALMDLIDRNLLIIAKDGHGRFFFVNDWWPVPPQAIPGQAYLIKVTQNCWFNWGPELEDQVNDFQIPDESTLSHFDFDLNSVHSSHNMSVVIRSISDDKAVPDGAEVACFTQDGKIAGARLIQSSNQSAGLAVWGDELLTVNEVEGFRTGENLTFRMWDPVQEEEYPISITVVEGENKYSENGILICDGKIERTVGSGSHPEQFVVTAMYPNPFNSSLTVNYTLLEPIDIHVGLYSIDGRLLKSVSHTDNSVGSHSTTIDASDLSAGIYLIQVGYSNRIQSSKVVLLK